jgi:hypothetical protein
MEIYLLFLVAAFTLGICTPQVRLGRMALVIIGMACMVSVGYFVFRLV